MVSLKTRHSGSDELGLAKDGVFIAAEFHEPAIGDLGQFPPGDGARRPGGQGGRLSPRRTTCRRAAFVPRPAPLRPARLMSRFWTRHIKPVQYR